MDSKVNLRSYIEVLILIGVLAITTTFTLASLYSHLWLLAIISTVVFMGAYRQLVDFRFFNEVPELRWILAKDDLCHRSRQSRFYFFSWFPMATMCAGWLVWYVLVFEELPENFWLGILIAAGLGFMYVECMGPNVKMMMKHQDALEKTVVALQVTGTFFVAGVIFAITQSFLPYAVGNMSQ